MSQTKNISRAHSSQPILFFCSVVLLAQLARAGANGPLPGINAMSPYLIYYGNWNTSMVNYARTNYRIVILHPAASITAAQIATIRSGPDGILGTADDVKVLAYLSIGEDDRNGVPLVDDGLGRRVDPASFRDLSTFQHHQSDWPALGGGTGYGSYYLNSTTNQTGKPDEDGVFGSYYVNAGAPAWWNVIKNMTKASSGQAGLDEILTTNVGNAFNCDGVFLDTIDTAGPDSWGLDYEWTAPGMQSLVQRIRTNYMGKLIMANRGLFYYDPNQITYPYTLRPYIDMLLFESYFSDSSTNDISPSFPANEYDFAPKVNAAGGDGRMALPYSLWITTIRRRSRRLLSTRTTQYGISVQGWPLYRTNPDLDEALNTNTAAWLVTNADSVPPVWDSTTSTSATPPAPRVGVQEVTVSNGCATVYWDVAHDQTRPACTIYITTPARR